MGAPSERRLAKNEVYFRRHNEQVQKELDKVEKIAREDGQKSYLDHTDMPLHFHCECSDENCRKRVPVPPSDYNQIHKRRDCFVIMPGHEVPTVERVIRKEAGFYVIQKLKAPPEEASGLSPTDIHNT